MVGQGLPVKRRVEFLAGLGGEGLADFRNDLIKGTRIVNRDFGEHLTIELNIGLLQSTDELAVADPMLSHSGADPGDPQLAKVAPASTAVAEGVDTGSNQGFLGGSQEFPPPADKTLGSLEHAFPCLGASSPFDRPHRTSLP